jgi:histidine triad (HIT) family protein
MSFCLFCAIGRAEVPAAVVFEDDACLAFLDHRPVFKGHTLVVPRAHVGTLSECPDELIPSLFGMARRIAVALEAGLGAQGAFVAVNNKVSQSVPHLHVHVVPRRKGDGLRGFFWPRSKYEGPEEMDEFAARIRAAV